MFETLKNHKFLNLFNQNLNKMRLTIFLAFLGCLFIGLQQAEACPLCTASDTCETNACTSPDIGIVDTAQGRIWVVCNCNTPVTVVVKKGDEEIDRKKLTKDSPKWNLSEDKDVSAGIYTIEAYHGNDDKPRQTITEVRVGN